MMKNRKLGAVEEESLKNTNVHANANGENSFMVWQKMPMFC